MRGFTLLEVLLTMALITVMVSVALPVSLAMLTRNDLDVSVVTWVHDLRRAQVLSRASDGGVRWGVSLSSSTITLFQGESYANRIQSSDESYALPSSITATGTQEIVFIKMTGLPQATGTTTLTANSGDVRTIIINAKGTIEY